MFANCACSNRSAAPRWLHCLKNLPSGQLYNAVGGFVSLITFLRIFVGNVVAKEQIDAVLLLSVTECVAQISTQCLHDVITLRSPGGSFPVRFDSMNEL